jgi:hypothetical protein
MDFQVQWEYPDLFTWILSVVFRGHSARVGPVGRFVGLTAKDPRSLGLGSHTLSQVAINAGRCARFFIARWAPFPSRLPPPRPGFPSPLNA